MGVQTSVNNRFVNPYTFVPLPPDVTREQPIAHGSVQEDLLFGSIDITWEVVRPVLLPADSAGEGWVMGGREVRIPGSSMKGALRSLHETMFNGCLRIIDADFIPVYRDPAVTPDPGLKLAVVTSDDNGRPTNMTVYDSVVWVEATALRAATHGTHSALPRTGDSVTIAADGTVRNPGLRRDECLNAAKLSRSRPAPGQQSGLLMVSDVAARPVYRKCDRTGTDPGWVGPARAFWAVGTRRVGNATVQPDAWESFLRASGETPETVKQRADPGSRPAGAPCYTPVRWWPWSTVPRTETFKADHDFTATAVDVAERQRVGQLLPTGTVMWVRTSGTAAALQITHLAAAYLWRHAGGTVTLGQRLPGASATSPSPLLPCRHVDVDPGDGAAAGSTEAPTFPRGLCLSCQIFGSANPDSGRGQGTQESYAAKIRVGPARGQVQTSTKRVPPMGQPRPGAGVFYLDNREIDTDATVRRGDVLSHWDSEVDGQPPRGMRGRKYYWAADPAEQKAACGFGRDEARTHQEQQHPSDEGRMGPQSRLVVNAGQFTQTITVDGLPAKHVATLLATIQPGRLLAKQGAHERTYVVRVGGGKPLGLGALSAKSVQVSLQTAADRYAANAAALTDLPLTDELRDELQRSSQLTDVLGALELVLDVNALDQGGFTNLVWYPPARRWSEAGTPDFDESFEFFGHYSGLMKRSRGAFRPLPHLPAAGESFDPTVEIE